MTTPVLYQCMFNEAVKCCMLDPCNGCEEFCIATTKHPRDPYWIRRALRDIHLGYKYGENVDNRLAKLRLKFTG